jgi:hypothetical protein
MLAFQASGTGSTPVRCIFASQSTYYNQVSALFVLFLNHYLLLRDYFHEKRFDSAQLFCYSTKVFRKFPFRRTYSGLQTLDLCGFYGCGYLVVISVRGSKYFIVVFREIRFDSIDLSMF